MSENVTETTGPDRQVPVVRLRWVGTAPVITDEGSTAEGLATLWLAVLRSGGAIGYRPDESVPVVRAGVASMVADAAVGRRDLLLAELAGTTVGCAALTRETMPHRRHCASITRLMVAPNRQRQGLGTLLISSVERRARAFGVEQLFLSLRDGEGLAEFHARLGWREIGRWKDGLRLTGHSYRDEVWFQRDLRSR